MPEITNAKVTIINIQSTSELPGGWLKQGNGNPLEFIATLQQQGINPDVIYTLETAQGARFNFFVSNQETIS